MEFVLQQRGGFANFLTYEGRFLICRYLGMWLD
jgi:hypothetical protein